MPRDGSGNYTKPVNSVDPAVPATTISSNDFNQLTSDLASEMTDSLDRSGKGGMLAALGMGAFKITNLGVPSVASDAARLDSVTGIALAGDVTGPTGTTVVGHVPGGKTDGLATGSFAPAGKVGEVVTASNSIALTTGVTANLTSVALTAGNWLLFAVFNTGPSGTTSAVNVVISTVSAVLTNQVANSYFALAVPVASGLPVNCSVGPAVANIASPTTYYMNVNLSFSSAMNIGGILTAIRLA